MSGDYINTKFMDKSAWDRIYSTSLEIYEFDKSRIISESQKFKLNAQTTFISCSGANFENSFRYTTVREASYR